MARPLRHIVDDVVEVLKQTFDDAVISDAQVAYWVIAIANRLKSQHILKRDSGAFLSTFILDVSMFQSNLNPNQVKNRKYIKLPKSIFDFDNDGGIDFIAYYRDDTKPNCPPEFTRLTFTRTTQKKAEIHYKNKYEVPSPSNPYFYRVGEYIYFLGIECVNIEKIEIGLYVTIDPVTEIDLDAPFDFPEELDAILIRQVYDLGRFSLLLPEERVNDGKADVGAQKVPTNKLVSVNDLNQDQNQNQ